MSIPGNQIQLINFNNLKDFYHAKITNLFIQSGGVPTDEVIAIEHGGTGSKTLEQFYEKFDMKPISEEYIISLFEEENANG